MNNANCTRCKFHKGCKNVGIWGKKASRRANPKIMIIQQAPSRLDDSWNGVLSGDGGEKLNWFLESAGINYEDVYFTSAVKCKPDKLSDITKKTIKACEPFLIEEIIEVQPEIIICMGKAGFQALLGHTSVYNFRGHIQDFKLKYDALNSDAILELDTKVMATFDLNGSFGKWEYNDDIIRDFKKVQKYVETKVVDKTPEPEVNLILSLEALDEWVERYSKVKYASTDFETTGLEFHKNLPFNAGYSHEVGKSDVLFILPYKNEHTEKWTIEDKRMAKRINDFVKPNQKRILEAMRKVHGGNTHWILHNGKFDGKFAMKLNIPYKRFWFDTMNADSLVDETLGHSLNIACERRGINFGAYDTKLWKYTNKDEKNKKTYQYVPPWLIVKYLGIDTDACLRLFYETHKELKEEGLLEHFLETKMQTVRDVMRLEYVGFMADKPLIEEAGEIITGKMDDAQKALEDFTGLDGFNVNSPQQMNKFMVSEGYPLDKAGLKTNKVGYSTAGDELDKLKSFKKNNCHLFPALVKEFKSMSKIKGTYVDGKYKAESERGEEVDADLGGMLKHIDKNGRIHTSYNLHSPVTGREGSRGPSVQVWPRPIEDLVNCRNFVVPTNKNWCLFEADYSAIEINIVAFLSKDPVLMEQLRKGTDLHCFNAVSIGGFLKILPSWVKYEHMMIMNEKEKALKDCTVEDIQRFKDEIALKDPDGELNWHELRTQAKALAFGLNYGKEAYTFAEDFGISEEEAQAMIDGYFKTYSVMKAWRDSVVEHALDEGFVSLLSGRKRRFYGATEWIYSDRGQNCKWSTNKTESEISRQAMNFPVQGGAHEVFEPALIRLNKRFRKEGLKARIMFRIHDGIVGECPIEERLLVNKCLNEELPCLLGAGTKDELQLKVDTDYYEWEWYGKKIKLEELDIAC
jgi:uracil-DNA glycosylase family 4